MVNLRPLFFSCLVIVIALTSCSVQKRVYRPGYHIVWNHSKVKETSSLANKSTKSNEQKLKPVETPIDDVVIASNSENNDIISLKSKPIILLAKDTCGDVMLLKNGEELKVKVLEVHDAEIKYKRCDNQNGPTYSISKNKVAVLKYANGAVDKFEAVEVYKPLDQKPKPVQKETNNWGLASFICAVAGCILGFPLILALPFAIISLKEFKKEPDRYEDKWMPRAALIISMVMYALVAMICLFIAAIISSYYTGGAAFFIAAAIFGALLIACIIALSTLG